MSYPYHLSIICTLDAVERVSALAVAYGAAEPGFVPQNELSGDGGVTLTHRGMGLPITEAMRQGLLATKNQAGAMDGIYYAITPNSPSGTFSGTNVAGIDVNGYIDFDTLRAALGLERITRDSVE